MDIVIGIDPDSQRHGVAVYLDGSLTELDTLELLGVQSLIYTCLAQPEASVRCSIEDVASQDFVYSRNARASKAAHAKVALSVGRCQQAQIELCRMLDRLGVDYQLHKPQAGNWAKRKAQFERATGWQARSNQDTRSAAYLGFLAINH